MRQGARQAMWHCNRQHIAVFRQDLSQYGLRQCGGGLRRRSTCGGGRLRAQTRQQRQDLRKPAIFRAFVAADERNRRAHQPERKQRRGGRADHCKFPLS